MLLQTVASALSEHVPFEYFEAMSDDVEQAKAEYEKSKAKAMVDKVLTSGGKW